MAASEAIANILASDDFFARLGLPRQKAEPAEVRRTYRRRALQCHPDKTDHPRANEAFQQLSEAFECLHEEKSQAAYLRTALQQHRREEQRHQKRKRGDGGGGDGKKRSAAGGTWYQRARSWADIERELARREEAERVMRAQFVASQSSKFNSREAERLLLRAQKICRTLDQRTSDAVNPLWATLVEQEAAAAALSEDLPEGWEARRSHGGVLYYFHAKTGQSSSVHPDPAVAAERERAREGAAAPSAPGAAAGASSSGGGNARGQLTEMLEYLHREHDFFDLDDEVDELDEAAGARAGAAGGAGGAGAGGGGGGGREAAGADDGGGGGGLGEGEYDY